jgi:hypothetical protein
MNGGRIITSPTLAVYLSGYKHAPFLIRPRGGGGSPLRLCGSRSWHRGMFVGRKMSANVFSSDRRPRLTPYHLARLHVAHDIDNNAMDNVEQREDGVWCFFRSLAKGRETPLRFHCLGDTLGLIDGRLSYFLTLEIQ